MPPAKNFNATATNGSAVTPSDTVDLPNAPCKLYIGVSGDVTVTMSGGAKLTFKAHPVGYAPLEVTRVWSTGTTATDMNALTG